MYNDFKHENRLETDRNITERLTGLVSVWLKERGLKASTAAQWIRFKDSYWWNYYRVNSRWWGFEVGKDDSVRRIV